MRRTSLQACGRPWLAGLVAFSIAIVGCGPLGGCGSGSVQSAEPEPPEVGHPLLVEGEPAPPEAPPAGEPASPAVPAVPEFTAAAAAAREAALGVFGEEAAAFGVYAVGQSVGQNPGHNPANDPQLANLDALPGSEGRALGALVPAPAEEGAESDPAAEGTDPTADAPVIDGNALGRFVPLEGAQTLEPFYRALRRLEDRKNNGENNGEDDAQKVRVLLYGASHTAADIYPAYLRAYLGQRFGDGGPGYVSLVQTNRWYRLLAWTVSSSRHWLVEHAQRRDSREDGFFGLLGASATSSRKAARTTLTPKTSPPDGVRRTIYDLYFLAQNRGGSFTATFTGTGSPGKDKSSRTPSSIKRTIRTRAKQAGPGYATVTLDGGLHSLELRPVGDGEVRLFGMTVEYDRPGVVVDTLGISGTRAANHLKWAPEIWADNLRRRAPDLIVLAYGTNEATDSDQPIAVYRRDLAAVLDRLREAAPEAACVLMGPGDFPLKLEDGTYGPRPRVLELATAQAEIARDKGCAFWDALAFMGGEGSMELWAQSTPQMGRGDHIHLTRRGYIRLGMAFTDALMHGFDASEPGPAEAQAQRATAPQTP